MKLFISNSTKQNYQFRYRVKKDGQVIKADIPYGQQISLEQDLSTEEIDFIIKQHSGDSNEYMVAEKDIDRAAGFVGLIYRIGSPVNAEKTAVAIDENDGILDRQSAQLRADTMSVIAANMTKDGARPAELASEMVEEVPRGSDKTAFSEGIDVDMKNGKR